MSTHCQCASKARNARLMVLLVAFACCLQGCTVTFPEQIPHFDTMSIGPLQRPAKRAKATTGRDRQKDAVAGGAVGATAGAAASLACGPFFALCAVMVMPVTAAGGAAGFVAGGVVDDHLKKLSGDKAARLEETLLDLRKRRDLQTEMLSAVTAAIPASRQVEPENATALILVGPKKIELVQSKTTELAVRVTGVLVARWDRRRRTNGGYEALTFVHQTDARPIDHWLERNGFWIEMAYNDAVTSITTKMIAEIR